MALYGRRSKQWLQEPPLAALPRQVVPFTYGTFLLHKCVPLKGHRRLQDIFFGHFEGNSRLTGPVILWL